MKKRIFVSIILSFAFFYAGAMDFADFIEANQANQQKIDTLLAMGTHQVTILGPGGNVVTQQTNDIELYLKHPDMLKIVISGTISGIIVQKGELLTQKMGESAAVTTAAGDDMDLFANYFGGDLSAELEAQNIVSRETVVVDGETLYKFIYKLEPGSNLQEMFSEIAFDRMDLYFNRDGMVVRQVLYNGETVVMQMDKVYIEKDGIFLLKQIKTSMNTMGMTMENTIEYTALSVNTEIKDKVFEIR